MARVLATLRPLHALIRQADDAVGLADRLVEMVAVGGDARAITETIAAEVTDKDLVRSVLEFANVLTRDGALTSAAATRLAQLHIMVEMTTADRWELVLTVPPFLRATMEDLVEAFGPAARPRETAVAISEIATMAQRTLIIAGPYLHCDFVEMLTPCVERVLGNDGAVTVITRGLSPASPEHSTANASAVADLRAAAARTGRHIVVRSWNDYGLGVHFKVVVGDNDLAYLGSANLTPGGMSGHAEVGVLLRGMRVREVTRWLMAVADTLAVRDRHAPGNSDGG